MSYNKRILSEIDRELKDRYRSKRYSKSLSATNSLFTVNDLFAKPSRGRVYNPNAQYFQGGGALKAIAKNSKKILKAKDLDVIKSAAKDFKKYAIRSSDITIPAIKKAQRRLLEATDPKSRTIMTGVELTHDGERLNITDGGRLRGSQDRNVRVLKRDDEERLQAFTEHLKEEADLLKSNAESYLENPYAIDLNRGDSLQFDKDGFLIEPLGGFYHGIGSTSPGFSLENLEFDRSKLDPEVLKGWTSTGNKAGNSKAEYGFFGALNKNQGSQAALKYDGTRERAIMDMLRDPSKRPGNLGTIKEIGLSPNARLVGGKSPYVLNALRDVGINVTEMTAGPHIGGQMGMTPEKAAILKSKYGIDGIIDLGGDELAIFNPDIITGVSDVPFKLFDYTNPLMQSLRQSEYTATDMGNILQNEFGSTFIHPERNQAYLPDPRGWMLDGADKLGSKLDQTNPYDARAILQTPGSYFRGGLRIDPYGRPDIFPAGLPFSEKWWKTAEPNLDLIRQKGGPINTSGPRAEEAPVDEDAMNAMMKARLAYEYEKGNPAAKRMVAPVDNPYDFGDGRTGTHYMSSYDNYAIPEIQDVDGTLEMTGPRDNEAIRFDREEDARYFANENYKRVSPMFINAELDDEEIQKYVDGGYVVEEMAEGGGVEVESCPTGQAWNGKYCVKIKNIVSDGKKVRVVPTPYEVENPSDDPLTQEFQSVDDIDSTIKRGKKQGYSDDMVDKMICQKGNCHVLTIDDDTEIENIEPVNKRRSIEDIYPEVDHDKYPTIEDFIFATDYYKENGEDPSDDLLPSNRVEEEPEVEPEVEIEKLSFIEPSFMSNSITGETITPEEDFNNDYKAKRVVDKETHYKVNKKGKIRRGPFGKKTTRRIRYELPEEEQMYPEDFVPRFAHGGSHDPPQENAETQRDWMINYIQSPMYLKRLSKEFPDYSNEDLEAEKNARLSNVKNVNIKYPDKPLEGYFTNVSGEYAPKKVKPDTFDRNIGTGKLTKPYYPSNKRGNLYLEPEYRPDNWDPAEGFNTTPLHEIGHAADDGGYRIPYKTEKLIYDSTNKAYEGLGARYDVPVDSYAQSVVSDMPFYYKNNPTEFVNRLIPLRYELEKAGIWKPGEEDFIDGMYNLMLKNPDVMKNAHIQHVLDSIPGANESRSKRDTVTKLLNEIALNDVEQDLNVAKHGGPQGGSLELGDEVTEDMVEELRIQGYTIEEI
jgi:hypothetical protein